MKNKMLFAAVEGELRNARAALLNADRYLGILRDAMNSMAQKESGEHLIPEAINDD